MKTEDYNGVAQNNDSTVSVIYHLNSFLEEKYNPYNQTW